MHPEVLALAEKDPPDRAVSRSPRRSASTSAWRNSTRASWGRGWCRWCGRSSTKSRKKEEILKARFEEARAEAINLSGQLAQIEMLERDVKRLSDMNDVLLNQIASLDLKQNGQEVRVAVIEEPVVATKPVSPRLSDVALLTAAGRLRRRPGAW